MLHSINMLRTLSCYLIVTFHVTEFINANYDRLSITFDLAEPGFHLFLLISGVILILITKPDDPPQKFMLKRMKMRRRFSTISTIPKKHRRRHSEQTSMCRCGWPDRPASILSAFPSAC